MATKKDIYSGSGFDIPITPLNSRAKVDEMKIEEPESRGEVPEEKPKAEVKQEKIKAKVTAHFEVRAVASPF